MKFILSRGCNGDYYYNFKSALTSTSKLKYRLQYPIYVNLMPCKSKRIYADYPAFLLKQHPIVRELQLFAHCGAVHSAIQKYSEQFFNESVYLTWGYYTIDNRDYFRFTLEDVKQWQKGIVDLSAIKLHCWLTLPSMEIIDFTTLSKENDTFKDAAVNKNYVFGTAESIFKKHRIKYFPLLVGTDFGERTFPMMWYYE